MRVTAAFLTVLCAIVCQQARANDPPAGSQPAASMTAAGPSAAEPGATPSAAEKSTAGGAEQRAPEAASTANKPVVTVVGAKPELTPDEKELISSGYKLEMHDGEKYFCRKEQQLGSRFEHKICDTARSALLRRAEGQEATRVIQTNAPHVNQ